ncbi:putative membrane protein [Agrobacterium vitis]|nr:putative membrane protein [Agrobacterium vitis]MBE1438488.1 putative membrane protein [Agrobacterium vitis]
MAGLSLRHFGYQAGLPFIIVKYGGSLLWGAMVYLLVAVLLVPRAQYQIILTAEILAIMVELVRLIHTPWLDEFRETATGALLLGKVFSLWNILAYTMGIVLAALIHQACKRR